MFSGKGKKSVANVNLEVLPVDDDKNSLKTVFHALESCDTFDTFLMLSELKPSYIILYDCDMTFVRQVGKIRKKIRIILIMIFILNSSGGVISSFQPHYGN